VSDFKIPEPNAVSKPTADISLTENDKGVVQTESFPVIPKKNDANDFVRPVRMSDLRNILYVTKSIKSEKIQWDEIAIGVATLGFGASISALLADVKIVTFLGKIFYIVLPVISFSASVFVIMLKFMKHKVASFSAHTIEEIIIKYTDSENSKDDSDELK
jgi:hypothetical protein